MSMLSQLPCEGRYRIHEFGWTIEIAQRIAELLADGRGILVPFGDNKAIARELIALLKDDVRRHAMRKQAYLLGREMVWAQVTQLLLKSFEQARFSRMKVVAPRLVLKTLDEEPRKLPILLLDHLRRLTDATGIFQHAKFSIPKFEEGYCTDDTARALLLTVVLEETADDTPAVSTLATIYSAFVNHAFISERRRFHNFMSFDRRWLDDEGSDGCFARALLALGACIGRSRREDLRRWAAELFNHVLPTIEETISPRAWALILVAIHEYFRHFSGDRVANRIRDTLTQRLLDRFHAASAEDWQWFETVLGYGNAHLSHSLILSGRWTSCSEAFEIGLRSLRWLMAVQTAESGHFRPVGSNGYYVRGGLRANFDQQPIEAWASVAACVEAWQATGDQSWMTEASRAFEWFLGRNDLGLPLYDATSGGCFDGLQVFKLIESISIKARNLRSLSCSLSRKCVGSRAQLRHFPNTSIVTPKHQKVVGTRILLMTNDQFVTGLWPKLGSSSAPARRVYFCARRDRCQYKTPVRSHMKSGLDQWSNAGRNPHVKYERPIFLSSIEVYSKNRAHL